MRSKGKLILYAQLHTAERLPWRPHQLKEYLSGHLNKEAAWKFIVRAGVAELQQEAERQASGTATADTEGCSASCPWCPHPVESVVHFLGTHLMRGPSFGRQ